MTRRFDEIELPEWASVTASVASELASLADAALESVESVESAIALALARKLDSGGEVSVAPVSKELREVMALLRARVPVEMKGTGGIADLTARIAARREATESSGGA